MALDSVGLQQPLRYTVDVKSGLFGVTFSLRLWK